MPAPAAAPSTAAITGFGQPVIARVMRCSPSIESACTCGGCDRLLEQPVQVAAGAERAVGAGQHDRADRRVVAGVAERLHRRLVDFRAERVACARVREREDERVIAPLDEQFGGHVSVAGVVSDTPSSARRVSHGDGR